MLANALTAVSKVQQVFSPSLHQSYQPGITSPTLPYASFVTIYLKPGYDKDEVKKAVGNVQDLNSTVSKIDSSAGVQTVVGIEAKTWEAFVDGEKSKIPRELSSFKEKIQNVAQPHATPIAAEPQHQNASDAIDEEEKLRFPETGGDLFLFVKASRQDLCFEVTKLFIRQLNRKNIASIDATNGFSYMGGKDLTGFHDGTRNPPILSAIADAAIMGSGGDDDPDRNFLGGSFVLTSKFVHDLDKFDTLMDSQKSALIGRDFTKTSTQLGKPMNPHLPDLFAPLDASADADIPSRRYHINRGYGVMYRQAYPFGTIAEHGLYFISFSCSLKVIDEALERMLGNKGGGSDNIFKITKPVTTNYYYCPSLKELYSL
eukprot:TRINITY_DN8991_c0_g1_i1.p1 TRINITY_DN8991_c0_g1~~TRINITY_DN8991_c0_g1_i1.p1  ORF type:complete len:373 (-),score=80.13 TRINITY_DN8991_c0_g1_i1:9-1127(-)